MPQKSLETLLQHDFETLTMHEQCRLLTAALRARHTPFHILFKRELPRCGARCRDGHPCQARATRDAETGCFVRNGRCRMHGGLSTGPRTATGKAAVALNAMKHGLLSQHVLLPDEDEPALVELGKRLRAHLQPVGELEVLLVDRIVTAVWRLRRALAIETSLFETYRADSFPVSPPVSLGNVIRRDHGDRLTRVLRYETTLERSLYKALHELQRLQAARDGVPVPPPAAVDVDVHVTGQSDEEDGS